MKAIDAEAIKLKEEGGTVYLATLVHPSAPDSLTITGADVEGMEDDDDLGIGSVLITPTKNYIVFDQVNTFIEKE